MINSVTFASRLKKVMTYYDLSASSFSEEIDFNRSTISHLLSGRNKPSLDFVLKVLNRFPDVTISWLLYGKGDFPPNQQNFNEEDISTEKTTEKILQTEVIQEKPNLDKEILETSTPISDKDSIVKSLVPKSSAKQIKRIVIFYTDSSFESYEN